MPKAKEQIGRRQRFKEYMNAFNPTASAREILDAGYAEESIHHDLYRHLAVRADLEQGSQQLLVGGIGSGKTTELILADKWLDTSEVQAIYIDLTRETDLSTLKSGSLLASFGIHLTRLIESKIGTLRELTKEEEVSFQGAKSVVHEFAHGKTIRTWVSDDEGSESEYEDYDHEPGYYSVTEVPGKLSPPLPKIKSDIRNIAKPLRGLLHLLALLEPDKDHVVLICDGLDRLRTSEKFWEVAHHDCRVLRQLAVSLLLSGPLSVLYQNREISEEFDRVQHLTAFQTEGPGMMLLEAVVRKRGGEKLLRPEQIAKLCDWSGGVLRDLITIARDAAEEAYLAGKELIEDGEIEMAGRQLGTSYLRGLGSRDQLRLKRLQKNGNFDVTDSDDLKLLATRRVIEYSATDFRVHPALWDVLDSRKG